MVDVSHTNGASPARCWPKPAMHFSFTTDQLSTFKTDVIGCLFIEFLQCLRAAALNERSDSLCSGMLDDQVRRL
jgi:hypothetical protein